MDSQVDFIKQCLLEDFDDVLVTFGADDNDHIFESMNHYAVRFNHALDAIFGEIRRQLKSIKLPQAELSNDKAQGNCHAKDLLEPEINHRKQIWDQIKETVTEIDCEIRDQLANNGLITGEEKELILKNWKIELNWIKSSLTK